MSGLLSRQCQWLRKAMPAWTAPPPRAAGPTYRYTARRSGRTGGERGRNGEHVRRGRGGARETGLNYFSAAQRGGGERTRRRNVARRLLPLQAVPPPPRDHSARNAVSPPFYGHSPRPCSLSRAKPQNRSARSAQP